MRKFFTLLFVLMCLSSILFAQSKNGYLTPFSEERGGILYFGYKDDDGKAVIPAKYRMAETDKMYAMAIVQNDDGQWLAIDRNDKVILYPFINDSGPDFVFEGLFRIVDNGKIGFADLNGNIIINPEFDFADSFKDGLAEFAYGGNKEYIHGDEQWIWTNAQETGYINRSGQKFTKILKTGDDKRIAWTKSGRSFYINEKGMPVKELEPVKAKE